jgi:hypothetical protein
VLDSILGSIAGVELPKKVFNLGQGEYSYDVELMSYLILLAKPCTQRMCTQEHLFHTHGHKVFIDNQMS